MLQPKLTIFKALFSLYGGILKLTNPLKNIYRLSIAPKNNWILELVNNRYLKYQYEQCLVNYSMF